MSEVTQGIDFVKPLLVVGALLASLALGGCGDSQTPTQTSSGPEVTAGAYSDFTSVVVPLPHGKHVLCVISSVNLGWAISCDWEHAR